MSTSIDALPQGSWPRVMEDVCARVQVFGWHRRPVAMDLAQPHGSDGVFQVWRDSADFGQQAHGPAGTIITVTHKVTIGFFDVANTGNPDVFESQTVRHQWNVERALRGLAATGWYTRPAVQAMRNIDRLVVVKQETVVQSAVVATMAEIDIDSRITVLQSPEEAPAL